MATMIDTLEFAARLEQAGFEHDKARALAAAFALANETGREDLVTRPYLDCSACTARSANGRDPRRG